MFRSGANAIATLATVRQARSGALARLAQGVPARSRTVLRAGSPIRTVLRASADSVAAVSAVHRTIQIVLQILADTVAARDTIEVLVVEGDVLTFSFLAMIAHGADVAVVTGTAVVPGGMSASSGRAQVGGAGIAVVGAPYRPIRDCRMTALPLQAYVRRADIPIFIAAHGLVAYGRMDAKTGLTSIERTDIAILDARQTVLGRTGHADSRNAGFYRALVLVHNTGSPVVAGALGAIALVTSCHRAGVGILGTDLQLTDAESIDTDIIRGALVPVEAGDARPPGVAADTPHALVPAAFVIILRTGETVVLVLELALPGRALVLRALLAIVAKGRSINVAVAVVVGPVAGFESRSRGTARTQAVKRALPHATTGPVLIDVLALRRKLLLLGVGGALAWSSRPNALLGSIPFDRRCAHAAISGRAALLLRTLAAAEPTLGRVEDHASAILTVLRTQARQTQRRVWRFAHGYHITSDRGLLAHPTGRAVLDTGLAAHLLAQMEHAPARRAVLVLRTGTAEALRLNAPSDQVGGDLLPLGLGKKDFREGAGIDHLTKTGDASVGNVGGGIGTAGGEETVNRHSEHG
jgi:hypothetical protein